LTTQPKVKCAINFVRENDLDKLSLVLSRRWRGDWNDRYPTAVVK